MVTVILVLLIVYLVFKHYSDKSMPVTDDNPSILEENDQLKHDVGVLTEKLDQLSIRYNSLVDQHEALQDKQKETVHTLGSERVRLGQVAENLAPFLANFKYNPKHARVLLNPIDYIVFTEDEIVFLEVKSGNAKLSEKQRAIKKVIEAGRVRFEVMRINSEASSETVEE